MAVIEAIRTIYLEADAASVTFDDIPSTYEHLQVRLATRDTSSNIYGPITEESLYIQLGDSGHSPVDTGTNYTRHYIDGVRTTLSAGAQGSGQSDIWLGKHPSGGNSGLETQGTDAPWYGSTMIDIFDYANAAKKTTVFAFSACMGLPIGYPRIRMVSGLWQDSSVVNAIKFTSADEYRRGSSFTLYGIQE